MLSLAFIANVHTHVRTSYLYKSKIQLRMCGIGRQSTVKQANCTPLDLALSK